MLKGWTVFQIKCTYLMELVASIGRGIMGSPMKTWSTNGDQPTRAVADLPLAVGNAFLPRVSLEDPPS